MKIPVIIDCDPGIDDAVALVMAMASEKLDVRAITTVAGNQTLDKTSRNGLDIIDFLGKNVRVAKGADRPLLRELVVAEYVHGESGLGNVVLPKSEKDFYRKNAFDTIYDEAILCEGKLHIIAVGPLTNIAITLLKYPEIKEKIDRITVMGGASAIGNITPAAEFNIYVDPEAAKIVYDSGIPITTVALDVTMKAVVYEEDVKEIFESSNTIVSKAGEMIKWIQYIGRKFGYEGGAMHDPLAVAAVIAPEIMETKKYRLDIETEGDYTRGKTVVDLYNVTGKEANTDFGVKVDREKFAKLLKELVMSCGI